MREWNCVYYTYPDIYIYMYDNRVQQSIESIFSWCGIYEIYTWLFSFGKLHQREKKKTFEEDGDDPFVWRRARVRAVRCKCFLPKRELCHWRRSGAYVVHTHKSRSPLSSPKCVNSVAGSWLIPQPRLFNKKEILFSSFVCDGVVSHNIGKSIRMRSRWGIGRCQCNT